MEKLSETYMLNPPLIINQNWARVEKNPKQKKLQLVFRN